MRPEETFRQRRREFLGFLAGGSFVTVAGCTDGPARGSVPTPSRVGSAISSADTPTDTPTDPSTDVSTDVSTDSVRLVPSHGDERDNFGVSVAVSDGTALVGAPWDETATGVESGAVYVFEREDRHWTERAVLTVDGQKGDTFGCSVALAGDTAVVGAPNASHPTLTPPDGEDYGGVPTGLAYVFDRAGGEWDRTATLAAADADTGDRFGDSVALGADTALLGAPSDEDPNGSGAGTAYVFDRSDGKWTQQAKLAAADGDTGDGFGGSVALGDDRALVGAPTDDASTGKDSGGAYVFDRTKSGWARGAKLAAPDGDSGDEFGHSVAVENTTAIVGAVGDEAPTGSTAGVAYVFERTANRWRVTDVLDPSTVDAADGFGVAVDLSGDRALVGAYGDELHEEFAGAAYAFERTGTAWTQRTTLGAEGGDHLDHFGWSVALEGQTSLVGAPTDEDPDGKRSGSAYVFDHRR